MIVIVASRGGAPTDPAWLHNLRANPAVEVSVKRGPVRPMIARELPPEERDELWREIVAIQPGYADYQSMTTRTIPIVVLTAAA